MKKFSFNKSDLMENNCLINEDGFISNGTLAIRQEFCSVRKTLNANFVTLKDFGIQAGMLLNPEWNTLKDVLEINKQFMSEIEILDKGNNFFIPIFYNNKYGMREKRLNKSMLERILRISPNIKLYADYDSNTAQLQIVLNNEIIGIIVVQS